MGGIWLARRTAGIESYLGYYHDVVFPKLGQPARLSVIAVGPVIGISLNGQNVLSVTDSTYTLGRVGLRINGDQSLPCDAIFADVEVQ